MKIVIIITVMGAAILLSGCASHPLTSPCPEFGSNCTKSPLNTQHFSDYKEQSHE